MRRPVLSLLLILAVLHLPSAARAGNLQLGLWPQFGMQRNNPVVVSNDYTGVGLVGRLGWAFGGDTIRPALFAECGFMSFGTEHWYVPLTLAQSDMFCDVYSQYRILAFCPGISIGINRGSLRPYLDVMGGPAYFNIDNHLTNARWTGPRVDQTEDLSHMSYVWGLGGGLRFVLWEKGEKQTDRLIKDIAIDLKALYQKSGQSNFIVKQNLRRPSEDGPVLYDKSSSDLDMVQFRFGASFQLL